MKCYVGRALLAVLYVVHCIVHTFNDGALVTQCRKNSLLVTRLRFTQAHAASYMFNSPPAPPLL